MIASPEPLPRRAGARGDRRGQARRDRQAAGGHGARGARAARRGGRRGRRRRRVPQPPLGRRLPDAAPRARRRAARPRRDVRVALRPLPPAGQGGRVARERRPRRRRRVVVGLGLAPRRPGDPAASARPRRSTPSSTSAAPGAAVEDDVFVALEHPGGVRSHLLRRRLRGRRPAALPRARRARRARCPMGWTSQEPQLRAGLRPGRPRLGRARDRRQRRRLVARRLRARSSRSRWSAGAGTRFYAGVVAAIRRRRPPPPVTLDEAIGVLDVLEAARDARARAATVVALG